MMESKNEYPNYYIRNTIKRIAPIAITHFENPFKKIADAHKEVITYKREDGLELSGILYLPPGYDKAKKKNFLLLYGHIQESTKMLVVPLRRHQTQILSLS